MTPQTLFRIVERVFFALLLMENMGIATAIFYPNMREGDFNAAAGDLHGPIAVVRIFVYGLGALLILLRWKKVFSATVVAWPMALLILLAPVSAMWSIDPALTLRRSALLLAMFFAAVYLGERYSLEKLATMAAQVYATVITCTLLLFFIAPSYVLDPDHAPAWRGFTAQKNLFGFYMAIGAILLFTVRFKRYEWLRYLFLCEALLLLVMSRSMTSLAASLLTVMVAPFWYLARASTKTKATAFAVGIVVLACAMFYRGAVGSVFFQLLGRDSTLTGRTDVWNAIVIAIRHHPYLGYGYACFWEGLRGNSLDVIIASGWLVPHAHNGYLELLIGFGALGAVIFLLMLVKAMSYGIHYIRHDRRAISGWPLIFLTFLLIHNLGESDIMTNLSTFATVMLIAVYTGLALAHRRSSIAEPRRSPVAIRAFRPVSAA